MAEFLQSDVLPVTSPYRFPSKALFPHSQGDFPQKTRNEQCHLYANDVISTLFNFQQTNKISLRYISIQQAEGMQHVFDQLVILSINTLIKCLFMYL